MADAPGTKESYADMQAGFDKKNAELIFPDYNSQHPKDFFHLNADNKCDTRVTADYDVNFAVVATDSGTVKKFVDLAKQLIDVKGLTPVTVLNDADKVIDTFDEAIKNTSAIGNQHFYLDVTPCCEKKNQWYRVTMIVDTRWLINDKTGGNDFARMSYHLMAGGQSASASYGFTGTSRNSEEVYPSQIVNAVEFRSDGPFTIYVGFEEQCSVSWSPNPTPWIACIRFDHIRLMIETAADCLDQAETTGKPTPPPPPPPKKKEYH
jgi:hypothetical protein